MIIEDTIKVNGKEFPYKYSNLDYELMPDAMKIPSDIKYIMDKDTGVLLNKMKDVIDDPIEKIKIVQDVDTIFRAQLHGKLIVDVRALIDNCSILEFRNIVRKFNKLVGFVPQYEANKNF